MKAVMLSLAAVSVAVAVLLSFSPVDPVYATCAGSNSMNVSFHDATTTALGAFTVECHVNSWALTFDPCCLNILRTDSPENLVNIDPDSVEFDPESIWVQGRGCIWNPTPPDPDEIIVSGTLDDKCDAGSLIIRVQLGAIGSQFTQPHVTNIPPYSGCP
jgi:hypothetical protein